jgi:hypothetical protein
MKSDSVHVPPDSTSRRRRENMPVNVVSNFLLLPVSTLSISVRGDNKEAEVITGAPCCTLLPISTMARCRFFDH